MATFLKVAYESLLLCVGLLLFSSGQTYDKAISSLDIMATIVAQNSIEINAQRPLDGVDLVLYLDGDSKEELHDDLFWRKWEQNTMAIRHGINKLGANNNQDKSAPEL